MYYMAGIQEEKTDDIMKLRLLISIRSTTETQPSLEGKIIQLVLTLCQCLEKTQGRDKIDQGDARKIIGIYNMMLNQTQRSSKKRRSTTLTSLIFLFYLSLSLQDCQLFISCT